MASKVFPIGDPGTIKYTKHFMQYAEAMDCVKALGDAPGEMVQRAFDSGQEKSINLPFKKIRWHAKAIRRLMKQSGPQELFGRTGRVEGMAAYLGLHQGRVTLLLVALDADGNDIPTIAVNWGQPCPPFC